MLISPYVHRASTCASTPTCVDVPGPRKETYSEQLLFIDSYMPQVRGGFSVDTTSTTSSSVQVWRPSPEQMTAPGAKEGPQVGVGVGLLVMVLVTVLMMLILEIIGVQHYVCLWLAARPRRQLEPGGIGRGSTRSG
jgi:hypothetical protein